MKKPGFVRFFRVFWVFLLFHRHYRLMCRCTEILEKGELGSYTPEEVAAMEDLSAFHRLLYITPRGISKKELNILSNVLRIEEN